MQILGLQFFDGSAAEAVQLSMEKGGLVVAPSGTCFARLTQDEVYRRALTEADLVLPDSGFMVLLWRLLRGRDITRISGLAYLTELLRRPELQQNGAVLWILPNADARGKTLHWLQAHGFATTPDDCQVAPIYGLPVEDSSIVEWIDAGRPRHVIIALSGGVQEKLGLYLREHCSHRPALHCIGGALGFITGYQVAIPDWADRFYLGWLFRLITDPGKFLPRAMNAVALPGMILRYGEHLPAAKS